MSLRFLKRPGHHEPEESGKAASASDVGKGAENGFSAFAREFGLEEPAPEADRKADGVAAVPEDSSTDAAGKAGAQHVPEGKPMLPLAPGSNLLIGTHAINIVALEGTQGEVNRYVGREAGGLGVLQVREAGLSSPAAARLDNEAQLRATFESPFIAPPVAFGEHQSGFYVVDARPSAESSLLKRLEGGMSPLELVPILAQVATALGQLHESGLVHGAIRPEAIIPGQPVTLTGFECLANLGVAGGAARLFPGYSAPECLSGEALDARTDIYGLGALLYRAAVGEPVPQGGVDWTKFAPRVSTPGIPQILRLCLGARDARYPNIAALHSDLLKLRRRALPVVTHALAGGSTIGLDPARPTNQDAWGTLGGSRFGEDAGGAWSAWIVADGMGGMAGGEVAAQVAVGAFLDCASRFAVEPGPFPDTAKALGLIKEWVREANRAVVETLDAHRAVGGCTVSAALVLDRRLFMANVGDCRLYLLRGDAALPLSRDHSYVMSLLLQGQIAEEEVRTHPDRAKVTRSLGDRHPMPEYFVDGLEVRTGQSVLELQAGDMLLASTDGLWEPVLEAQMVELCAKRSPSEAVSRLLEAAVAGGGRDNATVCLFRLDETAIPASVLQAGRGTKSV